MTFVKQELITQMTSSALNGGERANMMRKKLIRLMESKLKNEAVVFDFVKNDKCFLDSGGHTAEYSLTLGALREVFDGSDGWDFQRVERYPEGDMGMWCMLYDKLFPYGQPILMALYHLMSPDLTPIISYEDRDEFIEYASEVYAYEGGEETEELSAGEIVEAAVDFTLAIQKAKEGAYKEALEDACLSTFCEVASEYVFGESLAKEHIAKYLNTGLAWVLEDSAGCYSETYVFSSEELYSYNRYKDLLPQDVREEVDRAFGVLSSPISPYEAVSEEEELDHWMEMFEDDEKKSVFLIVSLLCSTEHRDRNVSYVFHPLFEYSLRWLVEKLPVLRQEYGGA